MTTYTRDRLDTWKGREWEGEGDREGAEGEREDEIHAEPGKVGKLVKRALYQFQ